MNDAIKRIHLDSIINALIWEEIPFEYDARELVIKLKGIDMTDVLLAIHDYNDEKMTDLYHEVIEAKEIIKKLYSHVFQGMGFMELNDYNVQKAEAEQFLKECE